MLGWIRQKAWNAAVGADFQDKYGINIIRLSQEKLGRTFTNMLCEKVAGKYYHSTSLGGDEIARIMEQAMEFR
jgi:hypothetical protein